MKAVEAVKEKFYCFLGIVHPTYYQSRGWGTWLGREARRRVKCGECPLVVAGPPWSQLLQEVNDTKSLAAGNWLQIDILRAEHESWKYPPSKLVTPNQTRHHRHYNYILLFQWFTGIDHSSAVEWLSRRFIKYSPTLQPPGVGLAIICKKRESREGLEDWPKNIAKNWETIDRKNITQLRKGHRQFLDRL